MKPITTTVAAVTAVLIHIAIADDIPVKGMNKIPPAAAEGLKK